MVLVGAVTDGWDKLIFLICWCKEERRRTNEVTSIMIALMIPLLEPGYKRD